MTTDNEHVASIVRPGFISAPQPVEIDPIMAGELNARETYDHITSRLQDLRYQRDDLNTEIHRLTEAEAVWSPIIRRLDTGIRHRKPKDGVPSAQAELLPET